MLFEDKTQPPRKRAEDLLARLTLREKVGQVNQRLFGFAIYSRKREDLELVQEFRDEVERYGGLGLLYGLYRADPWSQKDFENGLHGLWMKRAYNQVQRYVVEHSRFGIPALMSSECPHGHQALDGYLLPVNLAMGAACSPELTRDAFRVCGQQLKELGVDYALISRLDVLRDPRWGRCEECYSEDPYLAAALAKSAVAGCQEAGVPVVAKHFCAQGEGTGGVNASAARIGERELREIHLPPMKAAAEAGVQGVMAAYNEIDGIYCHANPWLLQHVLRDEMGFSGVVMADGTAIDRLDGLTGDPAASGALALRSGVDVSLWDRGFSHLEEAVNRGLVSEERLDQAVLRVLELKFAQGLFEHPYLEEEPPRLYSCQDFPQSLELARQSPVLLKNQGALPLGKGQKLALIGPAGDDVYSMLGDYTPPQREGACVTLREGLRQVLGQDLPFAQGCSFCGADGSGLAQAEALARESDLVILAMGGSSSRYSGARVDINGAAVMDGPVEMDCGEGVDVSSLRLPGQQEALARAVFAAGKPVVTVVVAGRPYALPEIVEQSQAVLYAFYPGPMGGQALAELLAGRRSPSGRLPASLPRSAGQLPCYYNPKASYSPTHYCDLPDGALFPFGYGLSYTSFAVEDVSFPQPVSRQALEAGQRVQVRFTLKNTGGMDAYAVPQLYLHDAQASTVRRRRELKAFQKIFLRAGEARACALSLGWEELALYDEAMHFTVEPGGFQLFLSEGGKDWAEGLLEVL